MSQITKLTKKQHNEWILKRFCSHYGGFKHNLSAEIVFTIQSVNILEKYSEKTEMLLKMCMRDRCHCDTFNGENIISICVRKLSEIMKEKEYENYLNDFIYQYHHRLSDKMEKIILHWI